MDINIIISGNLTGFSRFYASPNANDIYNEAKFDFDYRNFLTFINAGEKAYAISFSPKVIAVSLVTRILDSFRRPGILVVTALIPRYQLVSGTLNAQDKSAIYRLLNEINDKFYEKNFLNGMVNQNPAVLMQDYYSDILRNYALVSDRMQKAINTTIEVNSPNKRIGYVSTSEKDIPKYLSSLMRKSYNGYHHVFFADNAPTNIDEPAEEIVTYKVRVSNDNRPIHGEVRLDDRIPSVSPQPGEMPMPNQNYTYRQVLNGDAGNDILASLENDTIVLTYRFQQEEKTIYFKFYDGANEIPLHIIRPLIVESNGTSYPLSTDSWTFRGKEIYGLKTIKSGNSEYTVDSNCSRIDLQRLREGATHNVYVSKGWIWKFKPIDTRTGRPITISPVDIVLENRITGECRNFSGVTGAETERLPGNESDWVMKITSDYYEPITTTPNGGSYTLKRRQQPQPNQGGISQHTDVQRGGTQTKVQGHPSSNQNLKLFGGANDTAKEQTHIEAEKKKRLVQYGIYAVVAIICCIGCWWGYTIWKGDKGGGEIQPNESWVTKNVIFSLEDGSVNQPKIEDDNLALLDFTIASNSAKIEDGENQYSKTITYNPENSNDTIIVRVTFNKIDEAEPIIFAFNRYSIDELNEGINSIVLSVKNSELTSYRELKNEKIPENWESQLKRMANDSDKNVRAYAIHLVSLKDEIDAKAKADADAKAKAKADADAKAKADADAKAKADAEQAKQNDTNSSASGKSSFSDLSLELGRDKESIYSGKNKMTPKPGEQKQYDALLEVLKDIRSGKVPSTNPEALDSKQQEVLNDLRKIKQDIDKLTDETKKRRINGQLESKMRSCKSLYQVQKNINKDTKEGSVLDNLKKAK